MNILFLFEAPIIPAVGGVQRVTEILTKEFQQSGHNVYYLAYAHKHMLNYDKFSTLQFFIDSTSLTKTQIEISLSDIITDNNIEYVISQNLNNNYVLRLIPKGVKIVSVCHTQPFPIDNITREHIQKINARNLKEKCFKFLAICFPSLYRKYVELNEVRDTINAFNISDKVCYISSRFWLRVNKYVKKIPKSKFVAINNPNTFYPVSDIKTLEKDNLIIWVGRVNNENKNAIGFIKMWEIFHQNNPSWNALIIGDGIDLETNRDYIKKNQIKNIELLGIQEDVSKYYSKAKFLAVTSWSESWCMAITEAMSFGCVPCVYGTYESLYDIIVDNESGIITEPSERMMAERLQFYVDNENRREVMARNAVIRVNQFDASVIAGQWMDMLKEL